MKRTVNILIWCLICAYPLLVLYGLQTVSLTYLGLVLLGVAALRLYLLHDSAGSGLMPMMLAGLLALVVAYSVLAENERGLRFYPVAVNATFLTLFATSLLRGMPMIEHFARLREPDLPQSAIHYTRRVTQVWCGFFLCNGSVALFTALYCNFETWAWYNGGVAYVLVGVLFSLEWLVRQRVRKTDNAQAQ